MGGRTGPAHKPLLLLYALARLKHDRQIEIRFNATEAIVNPLLRSYGPWGSGAHASYPYGLVNDGLWLLRDPAELVDAKGNIREGVARERDAPAGFTTDVLAKLEREPELIEGMALRPRSWGEACMQMAPPLWRIRAELDQPLRLAALMAKFATRPKATSVEFMSAVRPNGLCVVIDMACLSPSRSRVTAGPNFEIRISR